MEQRDTPLSNPNAGELTDAGQVPRYLVFSLGGEVYGSPLEAIKEVLKYTEVKEVPYMKQYFRGVINLRGQIISVIDLRDKFGLKANTKSRGLLLVVEKGGQQLAAVVDDVISVTAVEEKDIDRQPALSTKIPMSFFLGIAKSHDRLINLIDIGGTLTADEFATVQRAKEVA